MTATLWYSRGFNYSTLEREGERKKERKRERKIDRKKERERGLR